MDFHSHHPRVKKPIICHLCSFSPATYGGTFVEAIVSLARYSRDNLKIETLCIFPEAAKGRQWLRLLEEEGVRYGFVPSRRNVTSKVRELLEDSEPLIFHSHFFFFDLSPVLLKLKFYRMSKILWHYHGASPSTYLQRAKDLVKFKFIGLPLGARCIACGDGVYRSLVEAGVPSEKVLLVHNGINTGRFFPDKTMRKSAREALGIADSEITTVFLLLGWDPVRKGVDIFVKAAFEAVRTGLRNSQFLIVGGSETREFVSKVPEFAGLNRVLRVIDSTEDFPSLLNATDALVCPSRNEGLSYSVAEALAAGKVAICSDIPGVREAYGEADGVWIVPTGDWETLAAAMKRFVKLPIEERTHIGEQNREYVMTRHSLAGWAEKIGGIYHRLVCETPPSTRMF